MEGKMRFVMAIALLLMTPLEGVAQQAITAGQLSANGFEIRASFASQNAGPALVLQKGADALLCQPLMASFMDFQLAQMTNDKEIKPIPAVQTVCAQMK